MGSEARLSKRSKHATEGDRRRARRAAEQSYEPIVPMKVGKCRALVRRGGHATHWREGGNRSTHR